MKKIIAIAALLVTGFVASAQIPIIPNRNIKPYAGFSTVVNGQRVIYIDPDRWPTFTPQAQAFLLQHEYGHHALHVGSYPRPEPVQEYEADVYAVNQLMGQFTREDWITVLNNLHRDNPQLAARLAGILRGRGVAV